MLVRLIPRKSVCDCSEFNSSLLVRIDLSLFPWQLFDQRVDNLKLVSFVLYGIPNFTLSANIYFHLRYIRPTHSRTNTPLYLNGSLITPNTLFCKDETAGIRSNRKCVCVFFPFILDIKFVGRTSRGHTGGRSHRIFNPPSFCGACLDFCREKDSAIPFPRRP